MRTLIHLSDLHFGRVDPRLIPPLVQVINTMAPDLVAVSGDVTSARAGASLSRRGRSGCS